MKVHELKSHPEGFAAVRANRKRFEIRRDDRDFRAGDMVVLREFRAEPVEFGDDAGPAGYTGDCEGPFRIGYVDRSKCLPEGWCGFALRRMFAEETPTDNFARIAAALDTLASTVDTHRNTIAIDDMSSER